MVYNWVTQMVEYCQLIPRLIPDQESYAKVIGSTKEIEDIVNNIQRVMEDNHQSCQQLQEHFMKYVEDCFIANMITSYLTYYCDHLAILCKKWNKL